MIGRFAPAYGITQTEAPYATTQDRRLFPARAGKCAPKIPFCNRTPALGQEAIERRFGLLLYSFSHFHLISTFAQNQSLVNDQFSLFALFGSRKLSEEKEFAILFLRLVQPTKRQSAHCVQFVAAN